MSFPGSVPSYTGFTAGHTLLADSHASQHNLEQADITAIATKMGTGASTPTNQKLLRGNGVGTSAWAQADLTTDVTGVLPLVNGGTGGATAATARSNLGLNTLAELLPSIYPVGCIYIETTGTNPGTSLGFGTWAAFAAGQTLIGVGTSDAAYTAGTTGGESNHVLTSNEMPSHTHIQDTHAHVMVTASGAGVTTGAQSALAGNNSANTSSVIATNQNTGGGATHNNLPPYVVCYFWKRTA